MTDSTSALPLLTSCAAIALLLHAALHDMLARTIPNTDCVLLALLGVIDRIWHKQILLSCALAFTVFLLCHCLWRQGWLGGGDVKLIAACCSLVAPVDVAGLIAAIACAGGVLGIAYLGLGIWARRAAGPATLRPHRLWPRFLRLEAWRLRRGAALPYGIAISAATAFSLAGG